ncbi:Coatomer subunit beta'-3 [Apostasia shenzhenica]|uniref:Coatomer subunit beta'-3 n=1 Tax=Apostasia shenzhenica TaxID=1088818 RepID=A0A2H9ZTB2_9ASPA|nr:Coatomer subunit beta'-3 [Apostasia shenzhenica]
MAQGYFVREEFEVDEFLDSREEFSSVFDSCPGSPATSHGPFYKENPFKLVASNPLYQVWIQSPGSIQERRANFKKWMNFHSVGSSHHSSDPDGELMVDDSMISDFDRLSSQDGVAPRDSESEDGSRGSVWSEDAPSTSGGRSSDMEFEYRIKNLDDGQVFVAGEFLHDGTLRSLQEVGSNRIMSIEEFERGYGSSSFVRQLMRRNDSLSRSSNEKIPRTRRVGWLRRLGAVACIADTQGYDFVSCISDSNSNGDERFQRVRVNHCRKQSKEFSAVYMGQNFPAHQGAISTMKFSPDGEYLASGGEDGVVRVWKVNECQTGKDDITDDDPSCIYFHVNYNSELSPLCHDKEKLIKAKSFRRTSDSACVVIPPELFKLSEKPFYEFHGHSGDVLDLAWSSENSLLSSSVDKTVRLWHLGCNRCINVFSHNNYVTCIQFNPVDEKYFISGSIDGKARIWDISACRVVDWIDVRQIITAACYRPDGKIVVVGSIMGDCRFYDASDNHLQLDAEISFQGKKKSVDKRINGFQFCPSNYCKLMVTSADSVVRILDGVHLVCKYKGFHNARTRISASFTVDGRHIVSASENSNVYMWNHSSPDYAHPLNQAKSSSSFERFASSHVFVAIPWHGFSSKNQQLGTSRLLSTHEEHMELTESNFQVESEVTSTLHLSQTQSFTLAHEYFSEVIPKGSATWPEEKLPACPRGLSKPHFKFLEASCQKCNSHAWGQVIVTAGLDGRIRSFQNFGLPCHL